MPNDLLARLRLPAASRSAVLEALAEESDGTMYGIVQGTTRAAEHDPGLTDCARDRLIRDGGLAALLAHEVCSTCVRSCHPAGLEAGIEVRQVLAPTCCPMSRAPGSAGTRCRLGQAPALERGREDSPWAVHVGPLVPPYGGSARAA